MTTFFYYWPEFVIVASINVRGNFYHSWRRGESVYELKNMVNSILHKLRLFWNRAASCVSVAWWLISCYGESYEDNYILLVNSRIKTKQMHISKLWRCVTGGFYIKFTNQAKKATQKIDLVYLSFGVWKRDQFQVCDSLYPKGPGSVIAVNYRLKGHSYCRTSAPCIVAGVWDDM